MLASRDNLHLSNKFTVDDIKEEKRKIAECIHRNKNKQIADNKASYQKIQEGKRKAKKDFISKSVGRYRNTQKVYQSKVENLQQSSEFLM